MYYLSVPIEKTSQLTFRHGKLLRNVTIAVFKKKKMQKNV